MRVLALGLCVCVCLTVFGVSPPSAAADTPLRRLRVLTWNINNGRSANDAAALNLQLDAIWAARPDVVALQRVTSNIAVQVESGLEARSGRAWTAASRFSTTDASAEGAMILTWLPVDATAGTALAGATTSAPAVRLQVTVNSWPVCLATARLDQDDATNRAGQLDALQQWLAAQPSRRVILGDFGAEPADALWSSWRASYQEVWQVLVFSLTQESGWTVDTRQPTGTPGRTDYQWYAAVNPTEVFLAKSTLSTHHALAADYEVR